MSGLDLTIPIDADWTAGAYEDGTVYLADHQTDTEVRLTGDPETLRQLLTDALGDIPAAAPDVARITGLTDHLERSLLNLEAALDRIEAPAPVEQRTVAEMEPGGWVRWPGGSLWHEVTGTSDRPGNPRGFVHYRTTDGTSLARDVDTAVTYDYLTAEAMGRVDAA